MTKISLFNAIKTISYIKTLIILIILIVVGFILFNYHSTTYYSCKVKLEDRSLDSNWYRVTVSVNSYFGDRYTLNQYKLSECFYNENQDLFSRDSVSCSNSTNKEKKEYLSFDIVNGSIQILEDKIYGNFSSYPEIILDTQECKKINRSID